MARSLHAPPAEPKSQTGGYVATILIVLLFCAMLVGSLWVNSRRDSTKPRAPIGFGPGWSCMGTSAKGGGFCVRTPPAEPQPINPTCCAPTPPPVRESAKP